MLELWQKYWYRLVALTPEHQVICRTINVLYATLKAHYQLENTFFSLILPHSPCNFPIQFPCVCSAFTVLNPHCTICRNSKPYHLKDSGDFPPLSSWRHIYGISHSRDKACPGKDTLPFLLFNRWLYMVHTKCSHSRGLLIKSSIIMYILTCPPAVRFTMRRQMQLVLR